MDFPGIITHKIPLERGKQKINQRDAYIELLALNDKDNTITYPGLCTVTGAISHVPRRILSWAAENPMGTLICPPNEMWFLSKQIIYVYKKGCMKSGVCVPLPSQPPQETEGEQNGQRDILVTRALHIYFTELLESR